MTVAAQPDGRDSIQGEGRGKPDPILLSLFANRCASEFVDHFYQCTAFNELSLRERSGSDEQSNHKQAIVRHFCRFMSIAEAMGRALQQTSISTNIKVSLPAHPRAGRASYDAQGCSRQRMNQQEAAMRHTC
jgi:hypothetical protein